jgi:hypothetical protein
MEHNLGRLRRQRNALAIFAVAIFLAGFGATLPHALAQYRALRAARNELVALQKQLVRLQNEILDSQSDLITVQRQVRAAQGN